MTDDGRVTTWTERDHLFGYLAAGQELTAMRHAWWEILWATADDDNVHAIVRPASHQPLLATASLRRPRGCPVAWRW
ncbi:MAG: hypothetical protein ACRDHL_02175, partial [Candidatus Promineifilaceae bacterium]